MTWPVEVNLCEDLVYKIQIENRRDAPVKVSLTFREANPDNPCNLVYPKGGMKQMVYSGQCKTFMILHKIVPDQVASTGEIHKLAIELFWKERIRMQGYRELSNQSKFFDPVYPETTQGQGT